MNTETTKSNPPPRSYSKLFRSASNSPAPRRVVAFGSRWFYGLVVIIVVRKYSSRDDVCVFEK